MPARSDGRLHLILVHLQCGDEGFLRDLDAAELGHLLFAFLLHPRRLCLPGEIQVNGKIMPVLSRFFGIVISMYYNDHKPAHFHAKYGGYEAKFRVDDGMLIIGQLPPRACTLVEEWRKRHLDELMTNWNLAQNHLPLVEIEPLE